MTRSRRNASRSSASLAQQTGGTAHGTSVSGAYRSPVDLSVRDALLVRDGTVVRCDEEVIEYVHAGPLSQELRWRWSLVLSERREP